jgi:hypothetical protein
MCGRCWCKGRFFIPKFILGFDTKTILVLSKFENLKARIFSCYIIIFHVKMHSCHMVKVILGIMHAAYYDYNNGNGSQNNNSN